MKAEKRDWVEPLHIRKVFVGWDRRFAGYSVRFQQETGCVIEIYRGGLIPAICCWTWYAITGKWKSMLP